MPTATITLPDAGPVLALPDLLHPVAELAAGTVPIRTWGVIACPDGGQPMLVATGKPNSVTAQRVAEIATAAWGQDRVFVAYRAPHVITLHTWDLCHPGHLLGSIEVQVDDDAAETAGHFWYHVVNSYTGDDAQAAEHSAVLHETWRTAHGLPAGCELDELISVMLANPLPAHVYLRTYIAVLGDPTALHACGVARREAARAAGA